MMLMLVEGQLSPWTAVPPRTVPPDICPPRLYYPWTTVLQGQLFPIDICPPDNCLPGELSSKTTVPPDNCPSGHLSPFRFVHSPLSIRNYCLKKKNRIWLTQWGL